ncbi:MAG: glycosyltransferase family 39 protein [Bryobacteraceae bacterium]
MSQAPAILGGCALTAAVSLALGLLLFDALRLPLKGLERAGLSFVTGSAILSLMVFLLAAAGYARKEIYIAFGLAVLAAAAWKRAFRFQSDTHSALSRPWRAGAVVLFGVFTCIYFLHAMAPEFSPDGSYYHLGFVGLYNDSGRLVKVVDNMYAHFPQAVEMLFLHAFSIGRHSAAALVHFLFLIALCTLIYAFGRKIGQPMAGLFAAFAVYASPIVGWTGTRAYIDVAVAAAIFGMFYLLTVWEDSGFDALLIPAGALAGFAFGSKYTAALAIPFGLGFILGKRNRLLRALLLFAAPAVGLFAPWLVRNRVWLGNPFSPFLNRWFPNPHVFPSFERPYADLVGWSEGLSGWAAVPLDLTIHGSYLQGLFGPVFLLAPLALLSLRTAPGRRLCIAALAFAVLYPFNVGARFLIPAIPFLALAIAMVLARKEWLVAMALAGHAITAYPAFLDLYCDPHALRLVATPTLAEAFRGVPEEEFLKSKRFGYEVARMVDRHVPPDAEVFSFVTFPEAYSRKKALTYYTSARANRITEILFTAMDAAPLFKGKPMLTGLSADLSPVCVADYRFEATTLHAIRLVQPTARSVLWTVTDVRIFSGDAEVHLPQSKPSASASPWFAWEAFDGNPVTLWSSREPAANGMYLQTEFAHPVTAGRVTVGGPRNQQGTAARLEGKTENGGWVVLDARPSVAIVPPPRNLRGLAAREVRRRGIEYLLVNEGNLVARDFHERARDWGVETVASAEGFTLYRIQ